MKIVLCLAALAELMIASGCDSDSNQIENSSEALDQVFVANDLDRDGCFSRSEWNVMARLARKGASDSGASNGNEFQHLLEEMFAELDSDLNGCVSKVEYQAGMAKNIG